jgi:ubiquinone/menaquinone biosynthesis C-methylase UbiE
MKLRAIGRTGAALMTAASLVALSTALSLAQTTVQSVSPQSKTDPKINDAFKKPDVKAYIKKFESEEREPYARRHEIVAALELKPGMVVADIGAGTGLFTRLIAEKVETRGKVYAVDIAPEFLAHIAADAKKNKRTQVVTVRGSQETTNLPKGSVDVAFICDVYHHLERPDSVLASLREAIKPGGRLVLVEFDRVEGKSAAFVLKHVRAGRNVFMKEIEAAGFKRIALPRAPMLKENFFAAFERIGATDGSEEPPRLRLR